MIEGKFLRAPEERYRARIRELEGKVRYYKSEADFYKKEVEILEKDLMDTYKELVKERKKREALEKLIKKTLVPKILLSPLEEREEVPPFPELKIDTEEIEKTREIIKRLKTKITESKKISHHDLRELARVCSIAEKDEELRESLFELLELLKKFAPTEVIHIKEGEIKEIDEDMIVRKRKDGVTEIIIL